MERFAGAQEKEGRLYASLNSFYERGLDYPSSFLLITGAGEYGGEGREENHRADKTARLPLSRLQRRRCEPQRNLLRRNNRTRNRLTTNG